MKQRKKQKEHLFSKISREGLRAGIRLGTVESRDWLRDRAMSITRVNVNSLMKDAPNMRTRITMTDIGRMFMFFYDPKHKKTLPYYDRFPLIFMIDRTPDGFLGLNMHYLPPIFRARLMDALYTIEKNDSLTEKKKLAISYNLLKNAAKYRYFLPTIKRYLSKHIRSRFLLVPYNDWDIALMLPTERFAKSSKQNVWNESKQLILGKR